MENIEARLEKLEQQLGWTTDLLHGLVGDLNGYVKEINAIREKVGQKENEPAGKGCRQ